MFGARKIGRPRDTNQAYRSPDVAMPTYLMRGRTITGEPSGRSMMFFAASDHGARRPAVSCRSASSLRDIRPRRPKTDGIARRRAVVTIYRGVGAVYHDPGQIALPRGASGPPGRMTCPPEPGTWEAARWRRPDNIESQPRRVAVRDRFSAVRKDKPVDAWRETFHKQHHTLRAATTPRRRKAVDIAKKATGVTHRSERPPPSARVNGEVSDRHRRVDDRAGFQRSSV